MLLDPYSLDYMVASRRASARKLTFHRVPRPARPRRRLHLSLGLWHIACWIDHGRTIDHQGPLQAS